MTGAKTTVEEALKRYRSLAYLLRRGGTIADYELALEALEAVERLVEVEQRELELIDDGSDLLR